ncbi:MAG: hypothetical protein ACYCY5_11225 [Sulfuricella sp.]
MLRAYQEPRHHPHNTRSPSGSQISIGIQAQGNGKIRAQGSVHIDGKQRTVEDWLGEQGQAAFDQGGKNLLAVDCKIFRHRGGVDEGGGIGEEGDRGKQEIGDATDYRVPDRDTFIL